MLTTNSFLPSSSIISSISHISTPIFYYNWFWTNYIQQILYPESPAIPHHSHPSASWFPLALLMESARPSIVYLVRFHSLENLWCCIAFKRSNCNSQGICRILPDVISFVPMLYKCRICSEGRYN